MIDLNAGYNLIEARQALKLWESFDITWLEEPLNPNHEGVIADLRSKSTVPIASGENEFYKTKSDLNCNGGCLYIVNNSSVEKITSKDIIAGNKAAEIKKYLKFK